MINLGDRVQDVISGINGIVVAKTQWLYGCERVTIEPEGNDKGKMFDRITVDMPQVKLLKSKILVAKKEQFISQPAGDRDDRAALRRNSSDVGHVRKGYGR